MDSIDDYTAEQMIISLLNRIDMHLDSKDCRCFNCRIRCKLLELQEIFTDLKDVKVSLDKIMKPW